MPFVRAFVTLTDRQSWPPFCGETKFARWPANHPHTASPTPNPPYRQQKRLTVRLLVTGAGTGTAELLGLHAAVIGDEEGTVELDESRLEGVLAVLVNVLLVVADDGLGNSLADGVDLRSAVT